VASISLYRSNDGWTFQRHSTRQLIPGPILDLIPNTSYPHIYGARHIGPGISSGCFDIIPAVLPIQPEVVPKTRSLEVHLNPEA